MQSLSRIFSALSDDTRLALVEHLITEGERPAGQLTALAGLSAPAVSRHLKVLRDAGLVEQRVDGTHRLYSVRPEGLRRITDWTLEHRAFWEGNLERLDTLLTLDPEGEDKT